MRRGICVVVLAVGAVAAAPAPAAAGFDCRSAPGKTLKRSEQVRVYSVPHRRSARDRVTYACLYRGGKRLLLDDPDRGFGAVVHDQYEGVGPIAIRGHLVVADRYVPQTQEYVDCDYDSIALFDLRRRKLLHDAEEPEHACGLGRAVVRVVLKANGSFAFGSRYGITKVERRGVRRWRSAELDEHRAVRPRTLRLRGRTLSWRRGERLRRAALR